MANKLAWRPLGELVRNSWDSDGREGGRLPGRLERWPGCIPPEQLIRKLREAQRLACLDAMTAGAVKQSEVSEQTLHRCFAQCGGMQTDGAKRLKDFEKENLQPKRFVASQALDLDAMRESARGNF